MTFLRHVAWTVVVFIGVSVTAVTPAHAQAVGDMEPIDCPVAPPNGFDLSCSLLTVPEDHANPDGAVIQIAVAVSTPVDNDDLPETPLVYLEGGPGYGSLDSIDYLLTYELFADRIVYFVDQRGTGYSLPSLFCDEFLFDKRAAFPVAYYSACAAAVADAGIQREMYTSAQIANDIAALVEAAGYLQVDLFGVSYGSRLALTVMRDHPSIVRRAILDSPVPLQINMYEQEVVNGYRSINALFSACAADDACNGAFPNLAERFHDWINTGQPVTIERLDETILTLRSREVPGMLFELLYVSEFIPQLPRAIHEMIEGNAGPIGRLYGRIIPSGSGQTGLSAAQDTSLGYADGMRLSVVCADELPFNSLRTAETLSLELPVMIRSGLYSAVQFMIGACRGWGVPASADIETQTVESSIPALVLSGAFDPITPPLFADAALEGLSNGQIIRVAHAGHGIVNVNRCVVELSLAFLDDPATRLDLTCLEDYVPFWRLR
ncbi:MAG: alpha/beta hydrolase [Chloroflexi bacterium]|nr:alpha/beta hydrolase [Chloroflexota bacterium]